MERQRALPSRGHPGSEDVSSAGSALNPEHFVARPDGLPALRAGRSAALAVVTKDRTSRVLPVGPRASKPASRRGVCERRY